ncbi:invasion protein IagB [Pandoraea aquatica]|uniref:Invasion protein IagB n=2 Tax=Pandoraea TaxID=93217 RepID=A0A5E4Z8L6_9BURK|nr:MULTISPECIES: lytic transglycosylase domain-containing protein [Pandoraea]UVA77156.1 lytic transglycosylase domain-containing protein [Pandoraea commovens]VVE56533.1 invasion protein IagB [Pandoraea aquatica]
MKRLLTAAALLATLAFNAAHAGIDDCFVRAAAQRNLDVNLLRAIGKVESNFRPHVVNKDSNAIGLMQIMPFHLGWLRKYGIYERDLFDACTNVNVASVLLADFIRMYGNTWRAVGAYGAGIKPDKENARNEYAKLVKRAYENIKHPIQPPSSRARSPSQAQQSRPTLLVLQ